MTTIDELHGSTPRPTATWLAYRPGPWLSLIAAPVLLLAPLVSAISAGDWGRAAYVLLLGGVFAVAVTLPFGSRRRPTVVTELLFALLLLLCTGYLVLWHVDEALLFPLLAVAASLAVRRRWAMGVVGSIAVTGAIAVGLDTRSLGAAVLVGFAAFAGGAGNFLVQYYVALARELDRTRGRLAVAAVAEERLRFSRDLHDLLGHSLSVIAVKSEVARRLMERDPDAAGAHITEVEAIAREALREVRTVVVGSRSVSLAHEIAGARRALEDAGVETEVSVPDRPLPLSVDAVLGWVVREGATNILRHARARMCTIEVTVMGRRAGIEVADDGPARADARRVPASDPNGSGLEGLRERVAAAGGEFAVEVSATRFRITASVPLPGEEQP
ncbi:two-component system sensor histidine kinase DesK [Agromyces terreus]|uniref:Two-component system sensor histidine kinase DesK n=1 Tax=Agromyces terreus TaxID=424795 RepID=A0A9X2KAV6_9MICO|nr:sensor histidine kinase [Agromyces terreus]MCP2369671.1 two-component system sensor histidine kinase DesK [Agromyces terreus]